MSHKSQRLSWRARCRRWQRTINAFLALAVVLAILLAVAPVAQAAPRCPNGGTPTPQGCIYQPDPRTVCAWPFRIVKVGRVTLCVRQAGEVQP